MRHALHAAKGVFRLVLMAAVLAAPAVGTITCVAVPSDPSDTRPGLRAWALLHPGATFDLYTDGLYIGVFSVLEGGPSYVIYLNNQPWVTANNPDGVYDEQSATDEINSLCPNGVLPVGTPPTFSSIARPRVASSTSPTGTAAGAFVSGDFNW
jgi:hypothetical protein